MRVKRSGLRNLYFWTWILQSFFLLGIRIFYWTQILSSILSKAWQWWFFLWSPLKQTFGCFSAPQWPFSISKALLNSSQRGGFDGTTISVVARKLPGVGQKVFSWISPTSKTKNLPFLASDGLIFSPFDGLLSPCSPLPWRILWAHLPPHCRCCEQQVFQFFSMLSPRQVLDFDSHSHSCAKVLSREGCLVWLYDCNCFPLERGPCVIASRPCNPLICCNALKGEYLGRK